MKYCLALLFVLCSCSIAYSQKIAIMDKQLQEPIVIADSLTTEQQQTNNYFAVEVECVDTFYAALKYVKTFLETGHDTTARGLKFTTLSTNITINGVLFFAFGKRYNILAKTNIQGVATAMLLSSKDIRNSRNAQKVEKLMKYMEATRWLLKPTANIHPSFYVEVVDTPVKK